MSDDTFSRNKYIGPLTSVCEALFVFVKEVRLELCKGHHLGSVDNDSKSELVIKRLCYSEINTTSPICFCTEPEEAGNLQSKRKIPEEHASQCLSKVEESQDPWLHFEEVVLKCRESADFPPCVPKDKLKQMIDVDETFEGMLDFYHNRGLIILPGNLLYFHSVKHCFGNLNFCIVSYTK